jgi:alpha-glucosidase
VETRSLYLPVGARWADFWTGASYDGGQTVSVAAPLGRPPLFVREGAAIPLNIAEQSFDRRCDRRAFAVFAPVIGEVESASYEDDGETEDFRQGRCGHWRLAVSAASDRLVIQARWDGAVPPSGPLHLLLPPSETRMPTSAKGECLDWQERDGWRDMIVTAD